MFGVLNVYLKQRFCGQLSWESERNRYVYRYAPEYLADATAERLSFSLPLQAEPFDEERSYRFFANLLPPEVVRRKLEKCLHVSRNNVFGFLREIGGDCAGAVALYPPGVKPNLGEVEKLRELDDAQAAEILKSLKRRPLYAAGEDGYRYSAAGAQDKLVVRIRDGTMLLPLNGTPSTHIVKPGADGFPESVANELFCQRLAAALGIRAAGASVAVFGGERYYVSERFDREVVGGRIRRLHQEDFCQMLSVDPESKYESDGGPKFADLVKALRQAHATLGETLALIDMLAYNILIGNADAHAKNYSVVYRGRGLALAPLYDAVSTAVYRDLSREFAMSIGGEMRLECVGRDQFARLAEECAMSSKLFLARLDALAAAIRPAAEKVSQALSVECPSDVYAEIVNVIDSQLARLRASGQVGVEQNSGR